MIEFSAGRPAARSPNGMVTSPHALASRAGADVLRDGGTAVDAAVATSAALSVLYPHMTGVGGDAFWLIYDANANAVRYIDGGGRATSRGTIEAFARRGLDEVPYRGPLPGTLTVPGAVASWGMAHAAYGRLPLKRCLESAIGFARDGFPMTARLAHWLAATRDDLAKSPEAAAIFLKDDKILKNPDLARTLEAIASDGWYGFYDGEVARELVRYSDANDGFFTLDDLKAQSARWGEPIKGRYRDVTIYETPAPTQGFAVLKMLNLLEPFELHKKPFLGPDAVHLMVQAKQVAYHDRDRHLADPRFADVPMERLISKAYADERRALMDPDRALPWDRIPSYGSLTGDTVYIAVVDKAGNAVSLIHSLYGSFGAAVVAGRTGVVLQNRSAYFSLDPKSPNRVEPGKTPLAHADRLAGLPQRQAMGRRGLHGRRRPAADPHAGLQRHDRPWARHPAGARHAALPVRPLRPPRAARHAAHRGALSGRDHRRAGASRPPARPLGRLERDGGPCQRHHHRCRHRRAPGRRRPAQRR